MTTWSKKHLEMALQRIPPHPHPKRWLEQYTTPAPLAAEMLHTALLHGDIAGKVVADLGCGTGILAIGAALLGASRVYGVDVDVEALQVAKGWAEALGASVEFIAGDVREFGIEVDTVVQNPPFGDRPGHGDVPFLDKALEVAEVVYTFHDAKALPFLERILEGRGRVTLRRKLRFVLPRLFPFHARERKAIDVVLLRIESLRRVSGAGGGIRRDTLSPD